MIAFQLHVDAFVRSLRKLEADIVAGSRQALGQATAAAVLAAKATDKFEDRTGKLRASIVRGQRSTWRHFIKATAKHAAFVELGTRPHKIVAKGRALRFVAGGSLFFRKSVNHPGTRPRGFMQDAARVGQHELERMLERAINRALQG